MRKWIKKFFGTQDTPRTHGTQEDETNVSSEEDLPNYTVIEDSPWGIPVLDVQSFTQHMTSTSLDHNCAENALSYGGDDGKELALLLFESTRVTKSSLQLPLDGPLEDGIIKKPDAMEDKWALYIHNKQLLFIRGWTRQVLAKADLREEEDQVVVGPVYGSFCDENESPDYTRKVLEYLIRDYGLGEGLYTPIPFSFDDDHHAAALFAFSKFGRNAKFVTHHNAPQLPPKRPLCTHTPLHIAVARGESCRIEKALNAGVAANACGPDGLTALHWAVDQDPEKLQLLLDRGINVDLRSREGATALMQATQERYVDIAALLIERGAAVDAADSNGFTSLHRAAEMGEMAIVELLLKAGCNPNPIANEHTPMSLAEFRGEAAVIERLRGAMA